MSSIFIISMLEILLISFFVLDGIPHFLDEVVYHFQAKIFASGHLYAPKTPEGFFDYLFFYNADGKWFSRHFPGYPLVLSLGMLLNISRYINPLLSSLSLIVLYFLILEVSANERIAKYSILLILLSPFFPFMSASFMSHAASMLFCICFIFFFTKTVNSKKWIHPFFLGFFLGMEYITRPITFTAMALPFAIYFVILVLKGHMSIKKIILITIPLTLITSFFLYYNHTLTGEFFKTPMQLEDSVHLGFGPNEGIDDGRGGNTGFTVIQGIWQMKSKLVMLGVDLYGWGGFSLIFLPFALFDRKNRRWDYLLFLNFILVTLTYFIAFNRGMMYGARYYFCMLPFLSYFTVKGIGVSICFVKAVLQRIGIFKEGYVARNIILIFICLFFLRSGFEYFPAKIKFYSSLYPTRTMYKIIEEHNLHNALVFVRSFEGWTAGLIANSPFFDSDIIYAKDLGIKNVELIKLFPDRKAYLFSYDRYRDYGYLVELGDNGLPLFEGKTRKLERLE